MKRGLLSAMLAVALAVVLRRRRAARAEQLLWDEAASTSVTRDLR